MASQRARVTTSPVTSTLGSRPVLHSAFDTRSLKGATRTEKVFLGFKYIVWFLTFLSLLECSLLLLSLYLSGLPPLHGVLEESLGVADELPEPPEGEDIHGVHTFCLAAVVPHWVDPVLRDAKLLTDLTHL